MKPYLEFALELHQQGDLNKAEIAKRVQEHYNMRMIKQIIYLYLTQMIRLMVN